MKLTTLIVTFPVIIGLAFGSAAVPGPSRAVMFEARQGSQPDKCFYCDSYYKSCLKV